MAQNSIELDEPAEKVSGRSGSLRIYEGALEDPVSRRASSAPRGKLISLYKTPRSPRLSPFWKYFRENEGSSGNYLHRFGGEVVGILTTGHEN